MRRVLNFYLDESGARHPDRNPGSIAAHGHDWFALGGILVWEDEEPELRSRYSELCNDWGINYPLHSVDIRDRSKQFHWLAGDRARREAFIQALTAFLLSIPVIGLARVIDRPGYNDRYLPIYGRARWRLCKTAFAAVVERAVKYAIKSGGRLRVLPERWSSTDDGKLKE